MKRILVSLLLSAALSACATNSAVLDQSSAGPAPDFESVIADNISPRPKPADAPAVQGQPIFSAKKPDNVELSDLRRAVRTDLNGWAWQTCIRASVDGRQHAYAVFVKDNRVIDSRMALGPDQCDQGHYTPLKTAKPEPPKSKKSKPR